MISKIASINSNPKAFGELFGFKRIQAHKLGVQEVDGRAVAPLAVLPMGCSWALHFCQQAHVNIALRTGLGRHRLLSDRTPVPLLSDSEPVVSVYVDNGGILSTQRGIGRGGAADARGGGRDRLPGDAGNAPARWQSSADQEESLETEACHRETPEDWLRDGGADGFAYRSLYLCVPFAPPVPVHPTCWCPAVIPLELRAQRVTSSQRVVSARLLRFVTPGPAAGVLL